MPRLTRNSGPLSATPTVLALSGTTATPSRTLTLVNIVVAVLRTHGAEVDVWDLARHPLPTADPAFHHQPERHPSEVIQLLVHRAQQADAFVWGSPVYHNSYSGVLKNLLDHLEISQFEQKPVGLVSHGASHRSTQACDHLRLVARGLHAIAIPAQVITADSDFTMVDEGFNLANRAIADRVVRFVDELLTLTGRAARAHPETNNDAEVRMVSGNWAPATASRPR